MSKYPMITVKVPPHTDPKLAGKAIVRKPWQPNRFFTESPTQVEKTPDIVRMLLHGDLVEVHEEPDRPSKLEGPPPGAGIPMVTTPRGEEE